ncbi:MAG TPA: hypothetical protein VGG72_30280 [Bryobacteraceae bacterium]|jgi:hypothetical protein
MVPRCGIKAWTGISIAVVIALTEGKKAWDVWRESYFWTLPNYLVGAAISWAVGALSKTLG